ncbi:MAG: beta-lactamase family protein [Hyphomonadaceae bacterium]|nr:beta-lactamase family protein [Hyphomonadaceae bacterium]
MRGFLSALTIAVLAACEPAPSNSVPETPTVVDAPVAASELQDYVSRAHADNDLIALGAVVASKDGILDIAVAGQRAKNDSDPALTTDAWHLGSNTKALTALLYAQLVERGLAEWGATLPELFPELADEIDPAWQEITIEDLFAHRSGLKQMGGFWLNARRNDDRSVPDQRADTARAVLTEPPSKTPGEFDYNNLNYILAGAAMESILSAQADLPNSWEAAMQVLIFDRLAQEHHQTGFGFGPPPEGLQGHLVVLGAFMNPVGRGKAADNPMVLGPAGTLHATMEAHAALAVEFLKDDSAIVPLAMREKLFLPHPDPAGDYAMGWGVYDDPTYGRLYLHYGSNTMWTSRIIVAPDLDRVVIVNTNQFSDAAQQAIRTVSANVLDAAIAEHAPQ